jgi:hypothetical protein
LIAAQLADRLGAARGARLIHQGLRPVQRVGQYRVDPTCGCVWRKDWISPGKRWALLGEAGSAAGRGDRWAFATVNAFNRVSSWRHATCLGSGQAKRTHRHRHPDVIDSRKTSSWPLKYPPVFLS